MFLLSGEFTLKTIIFPLSSRQKDRISTNQAKNTVRSFPAVASLESGIVRNTERRRTTVWVSTEARTVWYPSENCNSGCIISSMNLNFGVDLQVFCVQERSGDQIHQNRPLPWKSFWHALLLRSISHFLKVFQLSAFGECWRTYNVVQETSSTFLWKEADAGLGVSRWEIVNHVNGQVRASVLPVVVEFFATLSLSGFFFLLRV